jgi:undecaprenyl diphosphate synthase
LPADIVGLIENVEKLTRDNSQINVTVALSYGGRQDIVHAVRALMRVATLGDLSPEVLDEQTFSRFLMTAELPEVDLMIRTGGEYRISNFLLWLSAYAELYFVPTLWPDFGKDEMGKALAFFAGRDRRYGGLPVEEMKSS